MGYMNKAILEAFAAKIKNMHNQAKAIAEHLPQDALKIHAEARACAVLVSEVGAQFNPRFNQEIFNKACQPD